MKVKMDGKSYQLSNTDIEFPWVNYGVSDPERKNRMLELTEQEWSPFYKYDNATVFIFCMSYAFAKDKTPMPPPKGSGSMPPSAFKEETRYLMRIVAIAKTENLKIIKKSNGKEGYVRICEEYASAGFDEVYNRLKNKDSSIPVENILQEMLTEVESSRTNKD